MHQWKVIIAYIHVHSMTKKGKKKINDDLYFHAYFRNTKLLKSSRTMIRNQVV